MNLTMDNKKHKDKQKQHDEPTVPNINLEEQVKEAVKHLEEQLERTKEDHLRMAADYSNLVKRTENEKRMLLELGNEKLLKELLEIYDDLETSAEHTDDKGIKNILVKFKKVIENAGLEEIAALNEDFDPNMHEAIETTEGPENKVVKVFRKGYKIKNKILRPSLVSVGRGN